MATHHNQHHHLRLATYAPEATSQDTHSAVTRGSQAETGSPQRPFERDSRSRSRSTRAANRHQCDLRHKHTLAHGSRAHTQALPTSTCDAHRGQTERVPVPRCQPSRLPGARARSLARSPPPRTLPSPTNHRPRWTHLSKPPPLRPTRPRQGGLGQRWPRGGRRAPGPPPSPPPEPSLNAPTAAFPLSAIHRLLPGSSRAPPGLLQSHLLLRVRSANRRLSSDK